MARMIPATGPAPTQSPRAEPAIYWRLAQQLSDDFTVIHSLPWISQAVATFDKWHRAIGELDFLVIHPQLGLLFVEVKGGHYVFDRNALILTSTGARVDPVAQVRRSAIGLQPWLQDTAGVSPKIAYAIAFPEDDHRNKRLPPGYMDRSTPTPTRITIDRNDLPRLGDRIIELMRYWQQTLQTPPLGPVQVEATVNAICPIADYRPGWRERIADDATRWLILTEEQAECLHHIARHQHMVITGRSGTGKTLLLQAHARDLAQAGQRVLLVAYNVRLVRHLRAQLERDGIQVTTFHRLCRWAYKLLQRPLQEDPDPDWYRSEGPAVLREAIEAQRFPDYDALLLDEAQALDPDWLQALATWFHNKTILISCDETQTFEYEPRTEAGTVAEILNIPAPFVLTRNLRSPRQVFERLQTVLPTDYQQTSPRPSEPDTLVEYIVENPSEYLERIIRELRAAGVDSRAITVVYTTMEPQLTDDLQACIYEVVRIDQFRGLEAPIVIVYAVGLDLFDLSRITCAYARGTSRCIAIYDSDSVLFSRGSVFRDLLVQAHPDIATRVAERAAWYSEHHWPPPVIDQLEVVLESPIYLYWSTSWHSWVLVPSWNKSRLAVEAWGQHLRHTTNLPVTVVHIRHGLPMRTEMPVMRIGQEARDIVARWGWCRRCGAWTRCRKPSRWGDANDTCLDCIPQQDDSRSIQDIIHALSDVSEAADIVERPHAYTREAQRTLSIFLIGLGRWNSLTTEERMLLGPWSMTDGSTGFWICKLLLGIEILRSAPGMRMSVRETADRYLATYPWLEGHVYPHDWCTWMAQACNAWKMHGWLTKVEKGVYSRADALPASDMPWREELDEEEP